MAQPNVIVDRPVHETHPTFEDRIQGTMYRQHCTNAGCGAYIEDVPHEPAQDFICDDCLEQ